MKYLLKAVMKSLLRNPRLSCSSSTSKIISSKRWMRLSRSGSLRNMGGLVIWTITTLQPTLAQAQIQRSFINPSFEQPTFGTAGQQCYVQVLPSVIPGWETTHGSVKAGSGNCSGYTSPGSVPLIEIWTSGFSSVSTATNAGKQFAELNAEQASELYQNICLYQGETINFSLLHRGRSSTTVPDVANFLIGLNTSPSAKVFGTFSTTSNGTVTTQPVAQNGAIIPSVTNNNAGNNWVRYNGTVPYTGATGNQPVGFAAVSTAGGNNTVGNFLDDVQFAGKPVIEFSASSGGGAESETTPTTNPPKLRIVGLVPTGGMTVPISIGGTVILGTDFNTISGTSTFNITIPAGNYDGSDATSLLTIPFTVINNNIPQGNRTITFTIQPSSSFFTSSTMTCGGSPIIISNYTIYDDDFLSGKVWDDADNSANNTFTNIHTGTEAGTNAEGLLNAILVDSNNKVLTTAPVAADGTYTFINVPFNQANVKIILSTTAGVVGNPAPAPALPPNWVKTSPLTTAAFNTGTNILNQDFGIEQLPTTNNVTASSQPNSGGTTIVPALSGTDPEDGTLGTGKSFKIITLPTNGTLSYNGVAVTAGQVITNYDPTKLTITPKSGTVTVSFTYAAVDTAGQPSATLGTVTMPFTATITPVTVSGTVFSDADADVTINGNDAGTNAGSSNLTIYAVDAAGKVLDKATVAANGIYSLTNIPTNSSVKLRLSNDSSIAIGGIAPTSPSLPTGWFHTGKNLNGTIDGTIATLGEIALTTTTTNFTNQNFGIRQSYVIAPDPVPNTCNPDYTGALTTGISASGGQLPVGSNDSNWTVEWIQGPSSSNPPNSVVDTPYALPRPVGVMPAVVVGKQAPGAWLSEPANARWISYPFRLSNNANGYHPDANLNGSTLEKIPKPGGTTDAVRLKFSSTITLPSNANTIAISLPIGVAVDNQFVSVKVNGVENLTPLPPPNAEASGYTSAFKLNLTKGWQPGVNTIEIVVDSGPDYAGFFLEVDASTTQVCSNSNLLLVKRITALNNGTATRNGDVLNVYKDDPANPYDDNQITVTNPNPPTLPADTDKWPNPSTFLIGGINGGYVRPGDEIEYTIYYLSTGDTPANNLLICDRVPENTTFVPTAFNSFLTKNTTGLPGGDRGIIWQNNGTLESLTNVGDGDAAEYLLPGIDPKINYPTIKCDGSNSNGAVVVKLGNIPIATAPGKPINSFGFIRFRVRVK